MKIFTIIVLLLYTSIFTMAQTPQTISYQGVLYNANAQVLADSTYNLTFKLYNEADATDALWTEAQTVATSKGVFSATLGAINPIALPFDVPYWLGVQVGGDAELVPRINLTSVPYSFRAKSVDKDAIVADNIKVAQVVKSVNGLRDSVRIVAGPNISIEERDGALVVTSTAQPPLTADALLYPTGFGDEFITLDLDRLTDQDGNAVSTYEVPEGKSLRIYGDPAGRSVAVGFVGHSQETRPGDSPGFDCPLEIIDGRTRRPCDVVLPVEPNLVLSSVVPQANTTKKTYAVFVDPASGTPCSSGLLVCPTITAVLTPKIPDAKTLVLYGNRLPDGNIFYAVPEGYKFVVTSLRGGEGSFQIDGRQVRISVLPLPFVLNEGTRIELIGSTDPRVPVSPLIVQGYLKPN